MLAAAALLSVLAILADASPIQKRYSGAVIKSGRTGTCLTLPSGTLPTDGSLLTVGDCATATKWDINPGSGSVVVTGTNYALDAGVNPHNNVPAKVWTSYPGATQQTWFLTGDNRIAITGGNQCLDEGDNGPQTYQCTTGNTNQVWYVSVPATASSSKAPASSSAAASSSAPASSAKASASSSAAPSSSAAASSSAAPSSSKASASASATPTGTGSTGSYLKWSGNNKLCATVSGPFADGSFVNLGTCTGSSSQKWIQATYGGIQLADTSAGSFCLDAGSNPASGTQMKIWQCYPGAPQQSFNYPGSGAGLFQTANNQCLDVNNQGNTQIQTWSCSSSDPQQQFYLSSN